MLKDCVWKGKRLSCSAIFSMQPTDQGMCCSFNKQKADEMFRASRYQDEILRLTEQDKRNSRDDSRLPEWYTKHLEYLIISCYKLSTTLLMKVQAGPRGWKIHGTLADA